MADETAYADAPGLATPVESAGRGDRRLPARAVSPTTCWTSASIAARRRSSCAPRPSSRSARRCATTQTLALQLPRRRSPPWTGWSASRATTWSITCSRSRPTRVVRLKMRVGDEETAPPGGADRSRRVWPARQLVRARGLRPLRHSLQRASRPDAHPDAARLGRPPAAQGLSAHRHPAARAALGRPGTVRPNRCQQGSGGRRCARPTAQARARLTTWRQTSADGADDATRRARHRECSLQIRGTRCS